MKKFCVYEKLVGLALKEFCVYEKRGGICEKTGTYCNLGVCPDEDLKKFTAERHGRWERVRFGSTDVFCSECNRLETTRDSNYKSRYCPYCGAKMDGEG